MPHLSFPSPSLIRFLALFCLMVWLPARTAPLYGHIDAGNRTSLAIDPAGQLWSWGKDQLKGNNASRPVRVAKNVVMARAAKGETAVYFITEDRTLWAIGTSQYGQLGLKTSGFILEPLMLLPHIVFIDAGHDTPFAIDEQGRLWTWGDDSPAKGKAAALSAPARSSVPVPPVPAFPAAPVNIADDIVQVSSAFSHTLALKKDGTLLAWGDNRNGELGDGTLTSREHPVKTDLAALGPRKIVKIATRAGESFALADDGTVWNWGQGWAVPAESGRTFPALRPERIAFIDHVRDFAPGWGHLLFLKQDGSVWIAGTGLLLNADRDDPENAFIEKPFRRFPPRQLLSGAAEIASGQNHILILKKDGTLLGMGTNANGELGRESGNKARHPLTITLSR